MFLAWDHYDVPALLEALLRTADFAAPGWAAKDVKSLRVLAEELFWFQDNGILNTCNLVRTAYVAALRLAERLLEQGGGAVGSARTAAEENGPNGPGTAAEENGSNGAKRRRVEVE